MPKLFAVMLALGATVSCSGSSDFTVVARGRVMTGARTRAPVAGGYVRLVEPQGPNGGHWIGLSFASTSGVPNKAVTNADGSYAFTIDAAAVDPSRGYPLFLAASDAAQTLTMLAELPMNTAVPGAELSIDINPTSTVAAQMICPGGVYPPPANTWCYSDPNNAAADNTSMMGVLDAALAGNLATLSPGTPPNWQTFASGFLNDPATFGEIKRVLTGQGITFGTATPTTIASNVARLPLVTAPTPGDANNLPPSGGGVCAHWSCGTSLQCAQVMGAPQGVQCTFEPGQSCSAWCQKYIPGNCTCS